MATETSPVFVPAFLSRGGQLREVLERRAAVMWVDQLCKNGCGRPMRLWRADLRLPVGEPDNGYQPTLVVTHLPVVQCGCGDGDSVHLFGGLGSGDARHKEPDLMIIEKAWSAEHPDWEWSFGEPTLVNEINPTED